MDIDRVPAAQLHSEPEVNSPVHALGEGTSEAIQPDLSNNPLHRNAPRTTPRIEASNIVHPVAMSSTSSENFNDTSSLQPLRSNIDRFAQPIRSLSARLPAELNTGKKVNNENEIDWIVPKEEKVSK